ncbi:MAG: type II toxin-antitoxin system mRNA interferase toxin, RelE/StbE family [Archaeoglobaceae archaeon]
MSQYKFEIKPTLEKKLIKIKKKDKAVFDATREKIKEIIQNPHHYKPLRHGMKGSRRVHVKKPFVLVFEIDDGNRMVHFLDLDHHDKIYKRKK